MLAPRHSNLKRHRARWTVLKKKVEDVGVKMKERVIDSFLTMSTSGELL